MIKLFISYSHLNDDLLSKFIGHLSPLERSKEIEVWYDKKIQAGDDYQKLIDLKIENADIICLLISSDFLASDNCIKEKDIALKLRLEKGIRIISVILSPCLWNDENLGLSNLLALPKDAKPITSFNIQDEGWLDVIRNINNVCKKISTIKNLKIKSEFLTLLNSADILSKSHKDKEILNLQDIFVFPNLKSYNEEEKQKNYDGEKFITEIINLGKVIIAGENQSGKTTLCKILFSIYRDLNYVPIYLSDENKFLGNTSTLLNDCYKEQYDCLVDFEQIDKERIVPIIDNFHFAKYQSKYIEQYKLFNNQVLIVDDIFGLNLKNQSLIRDYKKFKIKEFNSFERNILIKKWIGIKEESQIIINQNNFQKSIDTKTELIEQTLGIILGKGIMPSYPFYILSILAANDMENPLDSEISTQGHCYHALIYLYLRREGVKNDEIDIYWNFLTELSFWIFKKNTGGLNETDFEEFLKYYLEHFNLDIHIEKIKTVLLKVNICKFDSLNQYNFCYNYIYYFFIAKYLSEHIESEKKTINNILSKLHKDENAYISVFIAHHTKSNYVLDELLLNAEILFEKYSPATLDTKELSFFDANKDKLIEAVLPKFKHNHEEERNRLLLDKSRKEESMNEINEIQQDSDNEDIGSDLLVNIRLSIKTVEVMGQIIKNRSGSLPLERLQYIFEQGLKVHMRLLSSFIEVIKNEQSEREIVDFFTERIQQKIKEKDMTLPQIEALVKTLYWNLNFGVLHGFITKTIHSLGSANLLKISQYISDKESTPASFIVNQGIRMWYAKNLQIDNIANRIGENDFSETAKRILKFKIVEHCSLHRIDYKNLQLIESKLKISSKKLLLERNSEIHKSSSNRTPKTISMIK